MVQLHTKRLALICLAILPALMPSLALALDYRSVSTPKAVLFDAPSAQAKKIYILSQGYPVEVIVNLGDWLKVRDNLGGLNWIEAKSTSDKRMVLVRVAKAEMKQAANNSAKTIAYVEKDIVLELVSDEKNTGWVQVRHRDGLVGYLPAVALWGL